MSEVLPSYQSGSEFAYPEPYDVTKDQTLLFIDNRRYSSGVPSELTFSPAKALATWAKSSPGSWQAGQDARYSGYHRDLKDKFVPQEFSGQEHTFRQSLLGAVTENIRTSNNDPAYIDFHPHGHQARVAVQFDETLLRTLGTLGNKVPGIRLIDSSRHGLALHDIGETEHPSVALRNGYAVGDISAETGKTPEQRAQERKILIDLLSNVKGISENYSEEMKEIMVKLISHLFEGESKEFILVHDMMEITHHINSLKTAVFEAQIASEPMANSLYANFMTLLGETSLALVKPKFEEIFDRSPELILPLKDEVDQILKELEVAVHCRDENDQWVNWRTKSDSIVEKYGEYEKWRF